MAFAVLMCLIGVGLCIWGFFKLQDSIRYLEERVAALSAPAAADPEVIND